MEIGWLHIWSQIREHGPARIMGNRIALQALRSAIDAALNGSDGMAKVFATDGEGYGVTVQMSQVKSSLGNPPYLVRRVEEMMAVERKWDADMRKSIEKHKAESPTPPQEPADE